MFERAVLVVLPLVIACTPRSPESGISASGTSSGASHTGESSTTGTATASGGSVASTTDMATTSGSSGSSSSPVDLTGTSSSTTSDPSTGGAPPDLPASECDVWTNDCPEGQKCVPVHDDIVDPWYYKCVGILAEPHDGLGEPCKIINDIGQDTCGEQAFCFESPPITAHCAELCTGSEEDPACTEPNDACYFSIYGLPVCEHQCDLLAQDCGPFLSCRPLGDLPFVVCGEVYHDYQLFEPCSAMWDCAAGFSCVDSDLAVECDPESESCCLPYCDADEPNTCPGQGQTCVAWHDNLDDAAPVNIDVGVCQLPGP